jgi:hypothetical protein
MESRTVAGLAGTAVVVALGLLGAVSFVTNVVLASSGSLVIPTLATALVVIGFVAALSLTGGRSRQWLENPYW